MKKISTYFLLLFTISVILISCTKEDETETGPVDARDKFVAAWACHENSNQTVTNPVFTVNIILSTSNSTQLLLENFYGLGSSNKAYATISGDSLFIPAQTLAGNTVWGKGALQGASTLKLNYSVDDGSITDIVTATLTK